MTLDLSRHPCFNDKARHRFGRIHLPVAPKCNIQCNFCDRKSDCVNESRPGVTSAILSPGQAIHYLDQIIEKSPNIAVVGIAGPGDPFANAEATMETLERVRDKYPEMLLCVASNGLNVAPFAEHLARLEVSHVTLTINAVDPEIGAKVYGWVRYGKRVYRGVEGARLLLDRQLESLRARKQHGVTVKINTIIIPGLNDDHVAEARIAELEVGTPAMGGNEVEAIRAVAQQKLPCRTTAWCRAVRADLDAASEAEVDAVHLSLFASQIHFAAFNKEPSWTLRQIEELVPLAHSRFDYVSVGVQDASRAEMNFLLQCAKTAESAGAHRIRFADTVGIFSPMQVHQTMEFIKSQTNSIAIGFHAHNDLGMATANSVAAVLAGADSVDITVTGLGERAGNAPLEEVVMALHAAHAINTGVDLRQLRELARLVARCVDRPIPLTKPIVRDAIFQHESGIHVRGILADPRSFEPFEPETVGAPDRKIVLGKHSGAAAIRHVSASHVQAARRVKTG